jgi:hypothetical protein
LIRGRNKNYILIEKVNDKNRFWMFLNEQMLETNHNKLTPKEINEHKRTEFRVRCGATGRAEPTIFHLKQYIGFEKSGSETQLINRQIKNKKTS